MKLKKYDRKALQKFKPATKLDKLKYWYLQELVENLDHDPIIVLTDDEHQLRQNLQNIYGMLTDYNDPKTPTQVRDIVARWKNMSVHKAYRMSQELFGDVDQTEKIVLRSMQTELRRKAIQAIQADGNLEAYEKHDLIHKHMQRIEQINHLEDKDTMNMDQILELLQMPDTEFTMDTDALENTEDVNHTEIDG
jgi:hypothetical protein